LSELEKDGMIQRFEFTFDLAWKVMQDDLKLAGYKDARGRRACITQMAQDTFIDPFVWEDILVAPNELSHISDKAKSRDYLDKIIFDYHPAINEFKNTMTGKL